MRAIIAATVLVLLAAALLPRPSAAFSPPTATFLQAAPQGVPVDVQAFLDQQPGVLKQYRDGDRTAAAIIEGNSLYYGLSPYLLLTLLETSSQLLTNPTPTDSTLKQPFGTAGPVGFANQIEWASRELRAGLGPYDAPPKLTFSDGSSVVLSLDQAPEGVAVQRFLGQGRTRTEWDALNSRFMQASGVYFQGQLTNLFSRPQAQPTPQPAPPSSFTGTTNGFLFMPWPDGVSVVHLAYFDHTYPTVDSGGDGNQLVTTYLGEAVVQYDTHDGHDYFFPDQPIGTPILAAAPGTAYAWSSPGLGVVILHDNGYETVYWHLDQFDARFNGLVDTNRGVPVNTGDMLGTSGSTGFVIGTPHLHFEVRRNGRQVDPYGWFGFGSDPCAAYAGCEASPWLWNDSLRGKYNFTPPVLQYGADGFPVPHVPPDDINGTWLNPGGGTTNLLALSFNDNTPQATLSINPPRDLHLHVPFDEHVVQQVGAGVPRVEGPLAFEGGFNAQAGKSLNLLHHGGVAYQVQDNLPLDQGTLSLWARIPTQFENDGRAAYYVVAATANPDDPDGAHPGTFALRRELSDTDEPGRWNFWTTAADPATRDDLTVEDTLSPGWHHFAMTWESSTGSKALYIDGKRVARRTNVTLPTDVGERLQLGRFAYGEPQSGIWLDELAVFGTVLPTADIEALAQATTPLQVSQATVASSRLTLDTNAYDPEGGIMAIRLGRDGTMGDPTPYFDGFAWSLPAEEGDYVVAAEYYDSANNSTVISRTVTLNLPPQGSAYVSEVVADTRLRATLDITVTDQHQPIEMQVGTDPTFQGAPWQTAVPRAVWEMPVPRIDPTAPSVLPNLYIRFRDASGQMTEPALVLNANNRVYVPMIER